MSSVLKALIGFLSKLFSRSGGQERPSPGHWVRRELPFTLPKEYLTVALTANPITVLGTVADTNSMDPVFDAENLVILIQGANGPDMVALRDALHVGDIAVYLTLERGYVVHRIVEIGQDEDGKWFTFEGDNNAGIKDNIKVRPGNIAYVVVGTIY